MFRHRVIHLLSVASLLLLGGCVSYGPYYQDDYRGSVYRDGGYYAPADDTYGDYYYAPREADYRYVDSGPTYGFWRLDRYGCGFYGTCWSYYGYGGPRWPQSGWRFSLSQPWYYGAWGWGGYHRTYWPHTRHDWRDGHRDDRRNDLRRGERWGRGANPPIRDGYGEDAGRHHNAESEPRWRNPARNEEHVRDPRMMPPNPRGRMPRPEQEPHRTVLPASMLATPEDRVQPLPRHVAPEDDKYRMRQPVPRPEHYPSPSQEPRHSPRPEPGYVRSPRLAPTFERHERAQPERPAMPEPVIREPSRDDEYEP